MIYTVKNSEVDSGKTKNNWSSYWRWITNHLTVCVHLEAAVKEQKFLKLQIER